MKKTKTMKLSAIPDEVGILFVCKLLELGTDRKNLYRMRSSTIIIVEIAAIV
tara:strand:- start:110 stop:265 length:156 start_codon:yes stop_codon:yes gene_type:complete